MGKRALRMDMQAKKDEIEDFQNYSNMYIQDDRDKKLLAEHIISPLLMSSAKFQKFGARAQRVGLLS